jgi:pSer/pThr/pTyr-binding forkhead associated (FHA) protein
MKCSLIVQQGTGPAQRIPIKLAQFLIGRDPQCHLRPLSPLISKRHCAVLLRDGKAYIRDFDSTNGTFLNDKPVKGQSEVFDGDKLRLGPLVFEFHAEQAQADEKPAPVTAASLDEDSVAALLLDSDDAVAPGDLAAKAGQRSDDSTILNMPVPPNGSAEQTPSASSRQSVKAAAGDTSAAAKALLHKYSRRAHR